MIMKSSNDNKEVEGGKSFLASRVHNQSPTNNNALSISSRQPTSDTSHVKDNYSKGLLGADRTIVPKGSHQSENGHEPAAEGGSNGSSNRSDVSMGTLDEGPAHDSLDFEQFFQEGYCKASVPSDCAESTEAVTDSPCDREKSEEDGESDDLLGGVFAFSEEG